MEVWCDYSGVAGLKRGEQQQQQPGPCLYLQWIMSLSLSSALQNIFSHVWIILSSIIKKVLMSMSISSKMNRENTSNAPIIMLKYVQEFKYVYMQLAGQQFCRTVKKYFVVGLNIWTTTLMGSPKLNILYSKEPKYYSITVHFVDIFDNQFEFWFLYLTDCRRRDVGLGKTRCCIWSYLREVSSATQKQEFESENEMKTQWGFVSFYRNLTKDLRI